jgi:hypothetical protein
MFIPLIVLLMFGFGCLSGAISEYQEGNRSPQTVGAIVIFAIAFFGPLAYIATM